MGLLFIGPVCIDKKLRTGAIVTTHTQHVIVGSILGAGNWNFMTDSSTFPTEEIGVLKISILLLYSPTMGDFQLQISYFWKKMFRQAKIVWGQFTPWHNATGTDHSLDSDISLVSRCNNITASFQHVQTFLQCSLAQLTVDEQRPQLTANVQKMTPAFICSHQQHRHYTSSAQLH